jgi:hypothetical protein
MSHGLASPGRLTQGEQRALASFYAGRLPAGQLNAALAAARSAALAAQAAASQGSTDSPSLVPEPVPALRAA